MRALLVITCAKRAQYVRDTLDSVEREGGRLWPEPARLVAYNGDGMPYLGERRLHWERLRLPGFGGVMIHRSIAQWAAAHHVDHLTVCEDDLLFAPHALERIFASSVPEWAAGISWFDMSETTRATPPGLVRIPTNGGLPRRQWWGSQCFTWPLRTLQWLAAADWSSTRYGEQVMAQDILMGELLQGSPWPHYAVHAPNVVQHTGKVSAWDPSRRDGDFPDLLLSQSFTGGDCRDLWPIDLETP